MTRTQLLGFIALIAMPQAAQAHGIAGNRYFPGTLTFDDPAVADELVFSFSTLKHPAEDGGLVIDDTMPFTFVRLLTPDLAFGVDTSGIIRNRAGFPQGAGFGTTSLTLKGLLYKNEPHETLISAGFTWGIGDTGDHAVGAGRPDILQPGVFFGKGFGDLPDNLAFFRPFGIAGAVTADLPTSHSTTIVGVDSATGRFGPMTNSPISTAPGPLAAEPQAGRSAGALPPSSIPRFTGCCRNPSPGGCCSGSACCPRSPTAE